MTRHTLRGLSTLIPITLTAAVAVLISSQAIDSASEDANATFYVDCTVTASGEGQSAETAFKSIEEAVDAASEGDTVVVAKGIYKENVHVNGKNVVLRSTDPLDPAVVAATVIDGNQGGSVITFAGTEDEACVVRGFTIRNGSASSGGAIHGGSGTRATIENNVIVNNAAEYGGGIANCSGIIRNNVISGNTASESGGALWDCGARLLNDTIVGNSAPVAGGLANCDGAILNCILWGNEATEGGQIHQSSTPTFSCIQDWSGGGQGNVSEDPGLVDADGPDDDPSTCADNDYRLSADSPCVDTGKNEDWMSKAIDLDGNPRVLTGRSLLTVDMGAYEYVAALEIRTASLPAGVEGEPYNAQVQASGGVAPYEWSIAGGKLPDGLDIDHSTGAISGLPAAGSAGTSSFSVRVADARVQSREVEKLLSISLMTAEDALEARFAAEFDKLKTEVDGLIPDGAGWWVENNPAYAESWSRFIDLIAKYPHKRDELERAALEVLYRSRQFRLYNQHADQFLARSTNAEMRRQVLDWYLRSALEVPDPTQEDYARVIEIADALASDEQYKEKARLQEYSCMAEIRRISFPPPENAWWVKANPLFANSYVGVLALREGRPPSQIEIIEYEALKILFRSQQYATFCELVEKILPHITTPWRQTMVLDWYLHCASCWGAGDCQKTIEIGNLLESLPTYWDKGRIVNFVFDTILRYRGAEGAYPYLLGKLRRATDEKAVLMVLEYSYKHPGIFEGMSPGAIAELYHSKEEFISKTEENVDAIVKLRTTVAAYEAMTGRGI